MEAQKERIRQMEVELAQAREQLKLDQRRATIAHGDNSKFDLDVTTYATTVATINERLRQYRVHSYELIALASSLGIKTSDIADQKTVGSPFGAAPSTSCGYTKPKTTFSFGTGLNNSKFPVPIAQPKNQ